MAVEWPCKAGYVLLNENIQLMVCMSLKHLGEYWPNIDTGCMLLYCNCIRFITLRSKLSLTKFPSSK